MFVVTGGAGFIGSAVVWRLNREGIEDILIVDDPALLQSRGNLSARRFLGVLSKEEFLDRLKGAHPQCRHNQCKGVNYGITPKTNKG